MNKALITLLAKLSKAESGIVAGSSLTKAQQQAADEFARRTGAITQQPSGRGTVYRILQPAVVAQHWRQLSPDGIGVLDETPARAGHIGLFRDSKGGRHGHEHHYVILKSVDPNLIWINEHGERFALGEQSRVQGAAVLNVSLVSRWQCRGALWLIENQALFDQTDWLPDTSATVIYYQGQLSGVLLAWLQRQQIDGPLVFFPDYDGVGLSNYCRLHKALDRVPNFWLMPGWSEKLGRYGNSSLWKKQRDTWLSAERYLNAYCTDAELMKLLTQMREQGLALEQEAVWL